MDPKDYRCALVSKPKITKPCWDWWKIIPISLAPHLSIVAALSLLHPSRRYLHD